MFCFPCKLHVCRIRRENSRRDHRCMIPSRQRFSLNFVVNSGKQFVSNVENNVIHVSTLKWALVDVKNISLGGNMWYKAANNSDLTLTSLIPAHASDDPGPIAQITRGRKYPRTDSKINQTSTSHRMHGFTWIFLLIYYSRKRRSNIGSWKFREWMRSE